MFFQLLKKRRTNRRYKKYIRHYAPDFSIRLLKLACLLILLILIDAGGLIFFEGYSLGDALWMGMTTITTVGYGDISPVTIGGRLITVVTLYIFGIGILTYIVSEFIEFRLWRNAEKRYGRWRWKMKDHILVINTPNIDSAGYLKQLVRQFRKAPELAEYPVQILTDRFENGLPKEIVELGVVHFAGTGETADNLVAVNVSNASYIIVIARDHSHHHSDSLTFDVLDRIQEMGTKAVILAEATHDTNRKRLQRAGANIVIRPIRNYPEFLVRSLVAPGTEKVLEDLFTHDHAHMHRFDISFRNQRWQDLICRFVMSGAGIPMAYVADGEVQCNPMPSTVCNGEAIITLVNDAQTVTEQQVRRCFEQ